MAVQSIVHQVDDLFFAVHLDFVLHHVVEADVGVVVHEQRSSGLYQVLEFLLDPSLMNSFVVVVLEMLRELFIGAFSILGLLADGLPREVERLAMVAEHEQVHEVPRSSRPSLEAVVHLSHLGRNFGERELEI